MMSERGLDSEIIYNKPEHTKMIDLLLNQGNGPNNGVLHNPDMSKIYREIEFGMGELERLSDKSNFTKKELLAAVEKSSLSLAKMAGLMTIRDLALNAGDQENALDGKSAGTKSALLVAKLMANSVKQYISKYKDLIHGNTMAHMSESADNFDKLKSAVKTRKRRQIVVVPEAHYHSSYLDDVTQDLSIPESGSLFPEHHLDDSELGDNPKLLAKMVYRGYSASHGNRFGRDVSDQEAASESSDDSSSSDSEQSATSTSTTAAPSKPKKKIVRKKVVVKHAKTTTTTAAPLDETNTTASSDDSSEANKSEAGQSRADTPKAAKPVVPTTVGPKSLATTLAPKVANTTGAPGSGNNTKGTPVAEMESIEDRAFHVFKISASTGYVSGIKVALDNLSQAVTNLKNDSKYLNSNQIAFRDALEQGWKLGLEKSFDAESNVIWSKLKNSYNESKVFDEERPDAYDLGARLGYMIGTVVGYNTARKPDPTLDGLGGNLERALGSVPKYTVEELQQMASKRAAYSEASFAAFRAALKVGFMTGAKLGPKAGIFYVQRSGARSGAKIGATLGAEAGLRAGGDTTARVAVHEQSQQMNMVSPSVAQMGAKVAMSCGRDSGRVVGAIVGALAAAEGFKTYIDNSGYIEAVAGEYMRFRSGAEHGYKMGETTGMKIQVSSKSPFYIDLLKKINLNATPITQDLPQLTPEQLTKLKQLNNMTIDDSMNEITGDMTDGKKGKSLKAKLQLRVYPTDRKSNSILFKIVGKPMNNGSDDSLHLDHIYGFLSGSLTDDDPSSGGDSKLDLEDKALQILYDEAQRGIMPSSRDNLKVMTGYSAAEATGMNVDKDDKSANGTHFAGSIFDKGSTNNGTQSVIVNPPSSTAKAAMAASAPVASTAKPATKAGTGSTTAAPAKSKKKKKKAAATTKAP